MANEKHSLLYGIRDGKAVYIDELDSKKDKGLKCRCTCPKCGDLLEARLNFKDPNRVRYFAHYNPVECDIVRANQTAIHLMAKDIITRDRKVMFPAVKVSLQDTQAYASLRSEILKLAPTTALDDLKKLEESGPILNIPANVIEFDKVILEKPIADIVPDIVASKNGQDCLIEIAVTHFVDEEKTQKIRELGISTLEIDLSSLVEKALDTKGLADIIVNNPKHKKWIYNAVVAREANKIEETARAICQPYVDHYQEQHRVAQEQAEKANRKAAEIALRVERAPKLLHDAFLPENYQNLLQADRNDHQFHEFFKTLTMSKTCPQAPFFVDIPISGEFIFNCDRRIWQSSIFDKFVFNRKLPTTDKDNITCKKIESWIKHHQKQFQVRLDYNVECCVDGTWRHLMPDVIDQYLFYLKLLGFISYRRGHDGGGQVKANYAVVAPNQPMAQLLQSTIKQANPYAPIIDEVIELQMQRELKDSSDIRWKHEPPEVKEERLRKIQERSRAPQDVIMEGFNPERLSKWLTVVTNDASFIALYETLDMHIDSPSAPFYVNIPISGEFIFDCDRRIWQALIFNRFVYNHTAQNTDTRVSLHSRILDWIRNEQQYFSVNQRYNVQYRLSPYGTLFSLLPDVVRLYLQYLEQLGFIERGWQRSQGNTETITSHTTVPPHTQYAQLLKEAVENANPLAPDLDRQIKHHTNR